MNRQEFKYRQRGVAAIEMAISLPVMGINKFGHHHEAGILEGTAQLFASGHLVIGLVVLICSGVCSWCSTQAVRSQRSLRTRAGC